MKYFYGRNQLKQDLHTDKRGIFIHEQEVWFAHLGVNIGYEQDGSGSTFERPVVVIKRLGNMFFVVPVTTRGKDNRFYYTIPNHYFKRTSRLILSQAKVIDKNRFARKIGSIQKEDFFDIKKKLRAFLL